MKIGLVVPNIIEGGGVPAVACFIKDTIRRSGKFELKIISLATSAEDRDSILLRVPRSWLSGVGATTGIWNDFPFVKVGAMVGEFEFQRYRPRKVLTRALGDCDLIQVVCGSPAWAWAVCGLGKPVAVQCATRAIVERRRQEAIAYGPLGIWRRWMTKITDHFERKALQSADAIQVENSWMLDYAREVNVGRDVIVCYAPPGVDTVRFQPAAHRDLRTDPYILCVGRLDDPRKNVGMLLEAFANLRPDLNSTTRLVLAGSAGPGPTFWVRVKEIGLAGRVDFVSSPDADALVQLYSGASVFALSSDEEGLGMVILEAMACGIPVVSTRSGGPDGIITDGVDGFLVGLDDENAMADRLTRLLTDAALNVRMGLAARERIMTKYEAGVAGKAFLDVYDELLARRNLDDRVVG